MCLKEKLKTLLSVMSKKKGLEEIFQTEKVKKKVERDSPQDIKMLNKIIWKYDVIFKMNF